MRTRNNLFIYSIISILSAFLLILFFVAPKVKPDKDLVIYDVHADSPRIVKEDGSIEFSDYVRIRNMTDHLYDLTGLFLSDSRKNTQKLPLDGVVIGAKDSVMIKLDPSWNFALKRDGNEDVYLTDSRGNVLYKYKPSMKPQIPQLSADSGFYESDFYLKMSSKGNCTIYYTLDGSEPDENSQIYTEPIHVYDRSNEPNTVVNVPNTIKNYLDEGYTDAETGEYKLIEQPVEGPVDKAFIIRALTVDECGNKSDIVTKEYFFFGDKYKNIISIVADRDDLFGDYGILSTGKEYDEWYLNGKEGEQPSVNYNQKGRDWEIPADMDYFRGGTKVFGQKCGLKLQGRKTRDRRIKNFQLRARNSYSGSDVFEYDFFDNEPYRSDGIILDDSFNESVFLELVENENIIKQKTTEGVALFVNGEFWNNIYIRQRIDEKYFADHYNIQPENLILLSEAFPEIGGEDEKSAEEATAMYIAIDKFAEENDLELRENYEKIQTMMDIDNYIDYIAINTWIGNTDWGEFNNDMYWRTKTPDDSQYGDCRFRWILHDGDYAFNGDFELQNFQMLYEGPLYPSLIKNEEFRNSLSLRMEELGETTFSDANIAKITGSGKWNGTEAMEIKGFFEKRKLQIKDIEKSVLEYINRD